VDGEEVLTVLKFDGDTGGDNDYTQPQDVIAALEGAEAEDGYTYSDLYGEVVGYTVKASDEYYSFAKVEGDEGDEWWAVGYSDNPQTTGQDPEPPLMVEGEEYDVGYYVATDEGTWELVGVTNKVQGETEYYLIQEDGSAQQITGDNPDVEFFDAVEPPQLPEGATSYEQSGSIEIRDDSIFDDVTQEGAQQETFTVANQDENPPGDEDPPPL
jgi:hypothetical protein